LAGWVPQSALPQESFDLVVHVNVRAPPVLGRSADPMEVAWPIAFLCSPAASFVSGAILEVDGSSYVG
jgi:NAD(P)-dependent dehydrogenase (short-subunit alcohol dehydrogenase family)